MPMKKAVNLSMIIVAIMFGQNLAAQNNSTQIPELANQILSAKKISLELLHKYSWTSRTEILKSKEVLNIMIEQNQYTTEGQLVQKLINQQSAKMPKAFLIRNIADAERNNIEKFLYGLRDFLKKYALQETDQVTRFIAAATWQVADSTHEFVFTGKNVEQKGDELTWWVEGNHYSTARIEVNTVFEKNVVHFTGTFMRLRDGLNYMNWAEAYIPAKKITLQLQNFDYIME